MDIILPKNMDIKYNKLDNGIKYAVVNDMVDDMANIAVSIKVGSSSDPLDCFGLAHFLEHMLFLGSEKYKEENYFDKKIKEFGGYSNAYTSYNETVYYFSVNSNHLEEILDIFAQFFISPLFNPNSVDREINAVNSEHMKNLNNHFWYSRQLIFNLGEGLGRFSTGNIETFGDDTKLVREKMIRFYKEHYVPSNMSIIIQSKLEPDIMDGMIKNTFSILKSAPPTALTTNTPKHHRTEHQLIPTSEEQYIIYYWDVERMVKYHTNHVIDIIDMFINMRCEGSLYTTLMETTYITSIVTHYMDEGIFALIVYMNDDKNIKIINNIVEQFFTQLDKVDWDRLYKNYIKLCEFQFNNKKKEPNDILIGFLVNNIHYFDPKYIYSGRYMVIDPDYKLLKETVLKLHFDNVNIIYGFKNRMEKLKFEIEPYYKKKYCLLKKSYKNNENAFDFKVININGLYNIDELLLIKPHYNKNINHEKPIQLTKNMWYGGTSRFDEPFAAIELYFGNNIFFNTIYNCILTEIAVGIINYYIGVILCDYIMINYDINMNIISNESLVYLYIGGYNDKFIDVIKKILKRLKKIKPTKNIMKMQIKKYKTKLTELRSLSPFMYMEIILSCTMYKYSYNYIDKLNHLRDIKMSDIYMRMKEIINTPYWGCIYGNIDARKSILAEMDFTYPEYIPPNNIKTTNYIHPNEHEKNNCMMYLFKTSHMEDSVFDPYIIGLVSVITQLMSEPSYSYLRTEKQLGYLVSCNMLYDTMNYYIVIKVQSDKDTEYINKCVEELFILFKRKLEEKEMTTQLETVKKSIYTTLKQQFSNMNEMEELYMSEIRKHKFIYDRKDQIAEKVMEIKLNDIIKLYHSMLIEIKCISLVSK